MALKMCINGAIKLAMEIPNNPNPIIKVTKAKIIYSKFEAKANLIAPFIGRYLSYKFFFTPRFCYELSQYHVAANEKWALFKP